MNRLLLFCIAFLLLFAKANGDHLILDGRSVYFDGKSPLEQYHDIKNLTKKLVGFDGSQCYDCGCINFDAEWEIIDNKLYLSNIYGCPGNPALKADLKALFSNEPNIKIENGKIKADWFTGDIWLPQGQPIGNFDIINFYQTEKRVSISKGELIALKDFNYPHPQELIYLNTHTGDAIAKFIYSHIDWNKLPVLNTQTKRVIVSFETGPSGKPENIKLIRENPADALFNEETKRVFSLMPMGAYYRNGVLFKQMYTMPVNFSEESRQKYSH